MRKAFVIWGFLGFIANSIIHIGLFSGSVGVGTSTWASAVALMWIGGMIFFGLGAIIERIDANAGATNIKVTGDRTWKEQ
jgi:hypothetical protein